MNARSARLLLTTTLALLGAVACFEDPGVPNDSEATSGDGDGDGDNGDGDGTPGDGDGSGDGDGTPGDGDGSGDGDGDGSGDGDGAPGCEGEGEMLCGDTCIDTRFDPENCGSCNTPCPPFQLCGESMCKPEKYVFVTTERHAGDFGGVAGADTICATAAVTAQLPAGIYRAWISAGAASPSTFTTEGVYKTRNGGVVAYSWDQLRSGNLAGPIDRNEFGDLAMPVPVCNNAVSHGVWTSTAANGAGLMPHCNMWGTNSSSAMGLIGNASMTDSTWSDAGCMLPCNTLLPVYCIQQ